MDSINYSLLENLSDDELQVISRNIDLDMLLQPIKQNSKQYARQSSVLGRLEKKSLLVQKNLPNVAYDLFKKNDVNYVKLFAISVKNLKNVLLDIIETGTNGDVTVDKMKSFSCDDYLNLLNELAGQPGNSLDLNLFFVQLKLNDIIITDEVRKGISSGWERIEENKHVKIEAEMEIEKVKREQEIIAKDQIKAQKMQFTARISEMLEMQQKLEADISAKQQAISSFITESSEKDSMIHDLKEKLAKQKKENEVISQENEALSHDVEDLDAQVHAELAKAQEEWKKQWEIENQSLLRENSELNNKIEIMNQEILDKQKEYEELQLSLEKTKATIDEYMGTLQSKMSSSQSNNSSENIRQDETVKFDSSSTVSTLLVENGFINEDAQKCGNYQEFQAIVEDNLKIVGCKRKDEMLQDEISAAINTGLIPLLCGYGARKIAIAYMAARFGEMATIISIPNGFGNTRELDYAINAVCTKSVIIEDLFGRMSENIVLPILRKSIDKQVIFCCEDVSDLKYIEKYYFNYVHLVKVDRMYNGDILNIVFSEATEYFERTNYDNKTEGHKIVRLLLDQIDIADSYIISRGDLISYMMQEMQHGIDEVLKKWFQDELRIVLNEVQREKVLDIIESNPARFSADLAESI